MTFIAISAVSTGPVLEITLNRPDVRNAMSLAMVEELRQVLAQAEASVGSAHPTRVVVLRGAGGHFCAGGDLKDMAMARMRAMEAPAGTDPIAEVNAAFGRMCAAFADTPLAVVTVLEGTVMGGGLGLACVADVAIATETASFRLPETSLGVVPAQIAPFLVERIGHSQTRRLAVTGTAVDAAQALAIGLVHEVHPSDCLDAAIERVVHEILHAAPGAIASTKALLARARLAAPSALVNEAAAAFSRAARGPEGSEGMAAFMAGRKPHWAPQE